jgi:hypothetical protein
MLQGEGKLMDAIFHLLKGRELECPALWFPQRYRASKYLKSIT